MFEPDEFIFSTFAKFLKKRRKKAQQTQEHAVFLNDIKSRLTVVARAISGEPINIFEAEREGGYKDTNFFLPQRFSAFPTTQQNLSFYLFRVVYLSVQKKKGYNHTSGQICELQDAQNNARISAVHILPEVFQHYPITEKIHADLYQYFASISSKKEMPDFSFIYGKWMQDNPNKSQKKELSQISAHVKKAIDTEINTILKANAVEELHSLQIDKKAQEDYMLTHNFEKVETAEEWEGGWRDFDGDDDLKDHANALEELQMKYTVRVDDPVHSVFQADFIENTSIAESIETNTTAPHYTYDEWDFSKRRYKPAFCKVYPQKQQTTDVTYTKNTLSEHKSTLTALRKMLTSVNNKYQMQRRQTEGPEFDLDALTGLYTDIRSGHTPSEHIYLSKRKKEKDLSILILLDVSLSSDGYAAGNKVIDVEKQVSILFGEILNEFKVDFAINCFFSKTRNYSTYITLKDFDAPWNRAKHHIGGVSPAGYTRIGAALRHSGTLLDQRNSKNKWVILISDGKPNDYDKYEGSYGINDVKQALRELNHRHIHSYALAIEAQAKYYLPQMFGQNHYEILTSPVALLKALAKLYDKIKHQT
ncbi:VWA domain-containing protein [Arenibacter sp. GZD96]|uniref:nitric oxide reductase activation protein NorD n=1 Tax=Aurantibrevibacter litoralis TaxID=3106030 RepID=UPI002AFDD234|nr:VWA domain-containing protein [Arenibacter sp. GZD-96]MEA1785216.1 VWA domain-containing protein [Arenibacter sp. GZD-96]